MCEQLRPGGDGRDHVDVGGRTPDPLRECTEQHLVVIDQGEPDGVGDVRHVSLNLSAAVHDGGLLAK